MKVYISRFPKDDTKQRKIRVKIDPWDTWSMDDTLAHIIWPMLLQIKKNNRGFPSTLLPDNWNVLNEEERDAAEKWAGERWREILDKMIFSFEMIIEDHEDRALLAALYKDTEAPSDEAWAEYRKKHQDRSDKIQEGLDLFGMHLRDLWE